VRRHPAERRRPTAQCLRHSHEVKDRKERGVVGAGLEFLGREMDAVWTVWYQAGIQSTLRSMRWTRRRAGCNDASGLTGDIGQPHGDLERTPNWSVWRWMARGTPALIFSHWVGLTTAPGGWAGIASMSGVSVLVRDVVGVVRE
jgi:hypothetical protein